MLGGAKTASWAVVVVGYGDTWTGRGVVKWLARQWALFWFVYRVWDCERDPGVVDGSNWGVWPLGCTSTHLALIRFPSASMFSWILPSSSSAFWFVIGAPRKRGDRLPLPDTGISEQIGRRWQRDLPSVAREVQEVRPEGASRTDERWWWGRNRPHTMYLVGPK